MSRARHRYMFAGFLAIVAGGASAGACSSFGSESGGPDTDGGLPQETTTVDAGDAEAADTGAGACESLASLDEGFTSDFGQLGMAIEEGKGAVFIDQGALVATLPLAGSAQAERRQTFGGLPAPVGQARLSFVLKDLVDTPGSLFVELGCGLDFRTDPSTFTQVRLELRSSNLHLDDYIRLDGAVIQTGMGPSVASLTTKPQTLPIEIVVDIDPSDTQLITRLTVAGTSAFTKTTALSVPPTSFIVRCGILNSPQDPKEAGVQTYTVKIDDVKLQLCRRKP